MIVQYRPPRNNRRAPELYRALANRPKVTRRRTSVGSEVESPPEDPNGASSDKIRSASTDMSARKTTQLEPIHSPYLPSIASQSSSSALGPGEYQVLYSNSFVDGDMLMRVEDQLRLYGTAGLTDMPEPESPPPPPPAAQTSRTIAGLGLHTPPTSPTREWSFYAYDWSVRKLRHGSMVAVVGTVKSERDDLGEVCTDTGDSSHARRKQRQRHVQRTPEERWGPQVVAPEPRRRFNRLLANLDWRATPLGLPQTWHPNLSALMRLIETGPFPMFIVWGKEHATVL